MIKIYICEDIEEHRNRIRGIVKDIILEEELDMAIEIASPNPMEVLNKAKENDKDINIKYKDILFFETSDTIHKILLHAINRQVEFYGKMKDIEGTLDERFVRFHRAYLVNKDNISEIDKKNRIIHMINGEICYSSAKNLENFLY